jgi:hypothetical protein
VVSDNQFAFALADQLQKHSLEGLVDVERLNEDTLAFMRQDPTTGPVPAQNGAGDTTFSTARVSVPFTLTPDTGHTIILSPLRSKQSGTNVSPSSSPDGKSRVAEETSSSSNPPVVDELRALACVAFADHANFDADHMAASLSGGPTPTSRITVHGVFAGPSILVMMSMPIGLCNILTADRVCAFVGYVSSANLINHLPYSPPTPARVSDREVEDGKALLAVASAAVASPGIMPQARMTTATGTGFRHRGSQATSEHKDNVEDSVEMHEAAEQLKALSHFRQIGHEQSGHKRMRHDDGLDGGQGHDVSMSPGEAGESGADDSLYHADSPYVGHSRPKARRSLQKQGPKQDTRCTMCSHAPFKDTSSLRKHVAAAHTRPFPCAFNFAGCTSTFGSKNEWKRHIASQHLCLTFYRCSQCGPAAAEGKNNEFNRKDLFTQHLRRMHAPFTIKKALNKVDSKLQSEWEDHVKKMQTTCLKIRRSPPQRSACPKADCSNVFEGTGSWDDWTEHVGRHMEKGEASRLGVDRYLASWALHEGIIENDGNGGFKLTNGERESTSNGAGTEFFDESVNENGNGLAKLEDNIDRSLGNEMVG